MRNEVSAELRKQVAARAGHCCEYCRIAEQDAGFPLQVDHIISRKHGGTSNVENLALSCAVCNRHKGSDIASIDSVSGELARLFHPRTDGWADHFKMDGSLIRPLTAIGRVTVTILRCNDPERVEERRILRLLGRYR